MYQFLAVIGHHWPFRHGTGWLVERPSHLIRRWPTQCAFRLKDGRILEGDLNDRLFRSLYLYGAYEPLLTDAAINMVRAGDSVVDVGANVGVLSALFGRLVGSHGRVFSFEPVPKLFHLLDRTITLNSLTEVVKTFQFIVSDGMQQEMTIYVPHDHSHACSSLKENDFAEFTPYTCPAIALQKAQFIPSPPTLIKVDVEGAELSVLRGSEGWCHDARPPIWILEVNRQTAKRFGYSPNNLVDWLQQRGYHCFYWSNDETCELFSASINLPGNGSLYALPAWAIEEGRLPI